MCWGTEREGFEKDSELDIDRTNALAELLLLLRVLAQKKLQHMRLPKQKGPTCYAYACSLVLGHAYLRAPSKNWKKHRVFQEIKDDMLQKYYGLRYGFIKGLTSEIMELLACEGEDSEEVLNEFCNATTNQSAFANFSWQDWDDVVLRAEKKTEFTQVIKALSEGRWLLARFEMSTESLDAFCKLSSENGHDPCKILEKRDMFLPSSYASLAAYFDTYSHAVVLVHRDCETGVLGIDDITVPELAKILEGPTALDELTFLNSYGHKWGASGFFRVRDEHVLDGLQFFDVLYNGEIGSSESREQTLFETARYTMK